MRKFITILLLFSSIIFAQTDLDLGDIAFTAYKSESGDAFAFVLLKDIESGTEIVFTDQGWISSGGFFLDDAENTIFWISTSSLSYGTQILIEVFDNAGTDELRTNQGSVTGDTFGLSDGGDQLFAFQGERPTAGNENNFLAAIQMNGDWDTDPNIEFDSHTSFKPSVFTDGVNSIVILPEIDNAVYDCSTKSEDPNTLRSAANNSANWVVSKSYNNDDPPFLIPYCAEPLPVELVTFKALANNNNISLNWQTATEVNNYGFEIERKILKQVQNDNWEKIGFVEGYGNSNSPKFYNFTDKFLEQFGSYLYRLKQIDIDGTIEYSPEVEVYLGAPHNFELAQNYPNPFNPTTTIRYSIPDISAGNNMEVRLVIFDVLGQEVLKLVDETKNPGKYEVEFNASGLNSGVYFYKLEAGSFVQIKKLVLAK